MNDCKKGEIPQGLSPKKDSENIDFWTFKNLFYNKIIRLVFVNKPKQMFYSLRFPYNFYSNYLFSTLMIHFYKYYYFGVFSF